MALLLRGLSPGLLARQRLPGGWGSAPGNLLRPREATPVPPRCPPQGWAPRQMAGVPAYGPLGVRPRARCGTPPHGAVRDSPGVGAALGQSRHPACCALGGGATGGGEWRRGGGPAPGPSPPHEGGAAGWLRPRMAAASLLPAAPSAAPGGDAVSTAPSRAPRPAGCYGNGRTAGAVW